MGVTPTSTFKVVTLNILNDLSRWSERRSLLAADLAELEPDYTCPTPLRRIGRPRFREVYRGIGKYLLNLKANHAIGPWRGTLDYIFVNEHVRVMDCAVVLNDPAPHDPTLYPSDHCGLAATLTVGTA